MAQGDQGCWDSCGADGAPDSLGPGTLATLLLRQLRAHLPPCQPQINSSGAPEPLFCVHRRGSHVSLAPFLGDKRLSPSYTCPLPVAEFGTCWPRKRNAKQPRKRPILTSEPKFRPTGPLTPQTGSTTGQSTPRGSPVWIGLEAGIRCSAHQCSEVGLFLRCPLQSRTFAFHLPRPDPVDKVAPSLLASVAGHAGLLFFSWVYLDARPMFCHLPPPPSPRSTPPWEVHVTDQLHLHLHHLSHPASFRRAHEGHAKVRDPGPRGGRG